MAKMSLKTLNSHESQLIKMDEIILKITGLTKSYGNILALDDLNLEVKKGMVFGILGPNGSGKTTTLGILLGVLSPNSGNFSWFENGSADENRKRIGALLETPNFYPYLTAVQNLRIVCRIKNILNIEEEIENVLKVVKLFSRKDYAFRTYSLGMKQRLAIASALLGNPDVMVLDEPTNGLDPEGISEIRSLILNVANEGKTIIIASHQLDEIEKICSDVLILKNGKTLKVAGINQLEEKSRQIKLATSNLNDLKTLFLSQPEFKIIKSLDTHFIVEVPEDFSSTSINKLCFEHGIILSELIEVKKSLEDQFLDIVK